MSVSAGNLDALVGQSFTSADVSGLTIDSYSTTGTGTAEVVTSLAVTTKGTVNAAMYAGDVVTVQSVDDAANSVVVSVAHGDMVLGSGTLFVVGFTSNAFVVSAGSAATGAAKLDASGGHYAGASSDIAMLSYTPVVAGEALDFSTAGTFSAVAGVVATTVSGGTYSVPANSTTVTMPGTSSVVTDATGGYDLIESQGTDTVVAGSGTDTVFASGPQASVAGGGGHLVFVAGGGSYFAGGGTGSDTLYGGSGNDTLVGGSGGGNVLVAGSGNTTLSGGKADLMFGGTLATTFNGSTSGGDIMVGGTGTNTFNMAAGDLAYGGPGTDVFNAGKGTATIVEGGGTENVVFSTGSATAFAGAGTDTFAVVSGAGGTDAVVGLKANDHLVLRGFTVAQEQAALSSASHGSFGTALALSDGTKLTLFGVQTLGAGQVSVA